MSKTVERSRKTSTPKGGVLVFLVLLAVAGAFVANTTGPWKGWIERIKNPQAADSTEQAQVDREGDLEEDAADARKMPGAIDQMANEESVYKEGAFVAKAPEDDSGSKVDSEFEALYKEFLSKLKVPKPGDSIKLLLSDNTTVVSGKIRSITNVAVKVEIDKGMIGYAMQALSERSQRALFPKRTAKILAAREFTRRRQAKLEVSKPAATKPAAMKRTGTQTTAAKAASGTTRTVKYDARPSATPEHLRSSVEAIGVWIQAQQRRMGGKLANRVFAKQPDKQNVVLYVYMHDNFLQQDHEWRYQVTEGIWRIWSLRAVDAGIVSGPSQGHVVLVGRKNKIIGGSAAREASELWAEKRL